METTNLNTALSPHPHPVFLSLPFTNTYITATALACRGVWPICNLVGSLVSLFTHSGSCDIDQWVIGKAQVLWRAGCLQEMLKAPEAGAYHEACCIRRLTLMIQTAKSLSAHSFLFV